MDTTISMIDPKGDGSVTDMQSEHTEVLQNRITDLQQEIIKYQRMINDEATDNSIILAMLQHFTTRYSEQGRFDEVQDALEWAHDDTGLDWDVIAEAVDRMGICDPELCKRPYRVIVTVPVTVTVEVLATSEVNAEEEAQNEIDSNGLDCYYMEYDLYHSADFEVEES